MTDTDRLTTGTDRLTTGAGEPTDGADGSATVAQAAARLGTTVPRLRRLLARPEMAGCSRLEGIRTRRGTRTGTVVPVSQLPALRQALQAADGAAGAEKREQGRLQPFSTREARALEIALQQTQITLAAKDQTLAAKDQTIAGQARELAAKDEIIGLLKDKVAALEVNRERTQERPVPVRGKPPMPIGETAQEREQERPVRVPETRPLSLWDRFLGRR